jgi:poly-gamma-glutamate synthesis protein (capsule biosynthesis protein)
MKVRTVILPVLLTAIIITALLLMAMLGVATAYLVAANSEIRTTQVKIVILPPPYIAPELQDEEPVAALVEPDWPTEEKAVLSFVGDCTLGQNFDSGGWNSFSDIYQKVSPEYFFSGVSRVFAADDLTIANCEGPLTNSRNMREKGEEGPKYWFKGLPEYAYIFASGSVEVANLANNHTRDYGEEGYQDTKNALASYGVSYFGRDDILVRRIGGIAIGLFGLSTSADEKTIKGHIAALREAGAEVIIASFHGGLSSVSYIPSPAQRKAARAAIDNGASVVVGHHPHVLQGIERYNGGVIAYSLGNFCFGGNRNPKDKDTMIFQVTITKTGFATDVSYNVIPASISSRDDFNDYRPRVLEGYEAARVMEKISRLSAALED